MYTPSSFKFNDEERIIDFVRKHSFGIFFSESEGRPEATHLPFMIRRTDNGNLQLIAHFARANKHWQRIDPNKEVLVVFHGPHAYISPAWYKEQQTVPTWNYSAVHITGTATIIHEKDTLRNMVVDLMHLHETESDGNWDPESGAETTEKLLGGITGMIIDVNHIEGKLKFNQNRSEEDQLGVINNLDEKKAPSVKEMMTELRNQRK